MAARNRKRGKFIAQILQCKIETLSQANRVSNGLRAMGEKLSHLAGGFQITLGIWGQQKTGGIQMRMVAQALKYVEQWTVVIGCVKDTVGGEQWQLRRLRKLN